VVAQWIKVLAAKPDDRSFILGREMMARKNDFRKACKRMKLELASACPAENDTRILNCEAGGKGENQYL